MTELERICFKQNATELRRIAKVMGTLQTATNRIAAQGRIVDLQERLAEVIDTMESLKVVIAQPLKNGTNQ
tara:strand:- start:438 stop:650 length:213 start_codon:yes stop_codon:yes gene_type:complete